METTENNSQLQSEQAETLNAQNSANVAESSDSQISNDEISAADAEDAAEEAAQTEAYKNLSKAELVEKAKEIIANSGDSLQTVKADIEAIKHNFYRIFNQEKEDLKAKFIEEGGDAESYVPAEDPLEVQLKDALAEYKKKRQDEIQKEEAVKQKNLEMKKDLIVRLKHLNEAPEDFGKKMPDFRKIEEEWKAVGPVPATDVTKIRENYQNLREEFYDSLKINNELRDYDFKKNLDAKTQLCEEAEKLANEENVVSAFKTLQGLHEQWSELGPVAKEFRENIWNRFKAASTVINKKHNDYFDALRATEEDNYKKKSAICEQIEAIDTTNFATMKDWQEKSTLIQNLQQDWRKIGFAPKKFNTTVYERFRAACDKFFNLKSEFIKGEKAVLNENLAKKNALCEKAEALKDSTDWKETADKLTELQKEWKTIGPAPRKQADAVWKRFKAACDAFFDAKNNLFKARRNEEEDNLNKKKEIVDKIQTLVIGEDHKQAEAELRQLISDYTAVGHVPFKEKDNIYKAYKAAIDEKFDALNVASRQNGKKQNGDNSPKSEKARLMKQKSSIENDIVTYENNLGFFAASKTANSLKENIEKKIATMKNELKTINEKLAALEAEINKD